MFKSTVSCGNRTLDALMVRAKPGAHNDLLQYAQANNTPIECLCNSQKPRLSIRRVNNNFILAVWPNGGNKHDAECHFYRDENSEKIDAWASRNAVKVDDNGAITISPKFGLKRNTDLLAKAPSQQSRTTSTTRVQTRRATLGAVLDMLWMESRNNIWFGRERNLDNALYHVYDVVKRAKLGSTEMKLCTVLPGSNCGLNEDQFMNYLGTSSSSNVVSGLVIGEIADIKQTQFGWKIDVIGLKSAIYMSGVQFEALKSRNPGAFVMFKWQQRGLLLAHVEGSRSASGNQYLSFIDASILITSKDYIPVDSGYEAELSNLLVSQKRRFYKPMKVVDELLPDFVLTDLPQPCYMEVWGMSHEAYQQHKSIKIDRYKSTQKILWEWAAVNGSPIPNLPMSVI